MPAVPEVPSASRALPRAPRRWLRWAVVVVLIAGVTGVVVRRRLQPVPVTVTPVVRGTAVDAVYATGTVEAQDRVRVKAKAAGSIAELLVREGSVVKQGQLLARIDNPGVTFEVARGQVDLTAAAGRTEPQLQAVRSRIQSVESELASAHKDLARAEQLSLTGSIAVAELDRTRSRVQTLEANLAALRSELRSAEIDLRSSTSRQAVQLKALNARLRDTEVVAPLDGVVLSRRVEFGEVVAVNQDLFTVGDVSRLILEVSIDEADVGKVHDGRDGQPPSLAAINLYAFGEQAFAAQVFEILPDANRERKAFAAKLRFDAPPPGLRSGMSAEVNVIARKRENALLGPSAGIVAGLAWVIRDGRAERVSVESGIRDLLRTEVVAGLAEGEAVVVEGIDQLQPGTRVSVTERPMHKGEPLPDTQAAVRNTL